MRNAVVLVSDDRIFPAAAFAAYRIAGLNERDDTDIFIFTDSAAELRAAPSRDYPFRVVPIVTPGRAPMRPTLFRMVMPVQMASRYGRVLYLDVDTWVEDARALDILDIDMAGHTIAAVRDYFVAYSPDQEELDAVVGGRHQRYFNAGVMLIDCRRYVEEGVLESLGRLSGKPRMIGYLDQSILNLHFNGNFLELSPAFNLFDGPQWLMLARVCPPVVTHFSGGNKPWMGGEFRSDHRARREMERFFPTSPWPGFLPRFFNVGTVANPRPRRKVGSIESAFADDGPMARYLRETGFADVAAGITSLHLDALPPRRAPA